MNYKKIVTLVTQLSLLGLYVTNLIVSVLVVIDLGKQNSNNLFIGCCNITFYSFLILIFYIIDAYEEKDIFIACYTISILTFIFSFIIHRDYQNTITYLSFILSITQISLLIFTQALFSFIRYLSNNNPENYIPITIVVENKSEDCSICIESLNVDKIVSLVNCNHTFHEKCIKDWTMVHKHISCPICRQPVN